MEKEMFIELVGEKYSHRMEVTFDELLTRGREGIEKKGRRPDMAVHFLRISLCDEGRRSTRDEYDAERVMSEVVIDEFFPVFFYDLLQNEDFRSSVEESSHSSELGIIIGFPWGVEVETNGDVELVPVGVVLWMGGTRDLDRGWDQILGRDDFFRRVYPDERYPGESVFRDDRPKHRKMVDMDINPRPLNLLYMTKRPYVGNNGNQVIKVDFNGKRNVVASNGMGSHV